MHHFVGSSEYQIPYRNDDFEDCDQELFSGTKDFILEWTGMIIIFCIRILTLNFDIKWN